MKKNLARSIVLSLLTVSVCSVANADTIYTSTKQSMGQLSGNYPVDWTSDDSTGDFLRTSGMLNAMQVSVNGANLDKVEIKLNGIVGYEARGLEIYDGKTINISDYNQVNNLTAYGWRNPDSPNDVRYGSEITSIYAEKSTVNITGDTFIESIVEADPQNKDIISIAHNGIYAYGANAAINLLGNTYINTNIPNGMEEAYNSSYRGGASKNDAVTAKRGAEVNINLDGGKTVQLLGNLDVKGYDAGEDKGGTINVCLDTADSYWHGEEVRFDSEKDKFDAANAKLNVTLANGAQWLPDKEVTSISKITLKENGIINLHGINEHVHYDNGFTKDLTIGNLNTDGGIFRMDVNAKAAGDDGRNGSDFVSIQSGTGIAYVQPVLENKNDLSKITRQNAVWFSDAAKGIEFKPYLKVEEIEKGFLYDYKPIVDKNVKDTDISKYDGNNWYLVGIAAQNTPTTETAIGAATVDYATATARLEIDSLNKRLGELRNYDTAEKGAWVRFKGGEMRGSDDTYFKNKYRFYQIGYDAKENTNEEEDGRWHKGFAIHYTDGESSYLNGKGENDSRGISLYAGWEGNKGHYADYVLKYSHLHNDFTAYGIDGTADGDFSNYAISASAEYGRKNLMKHDWIFEPQAQLVYTYLSGADYITSNNISVDMDSTNSLIGRAGFRLGREYDQEIPEKRSKWYLKADILHEFCGDRDIDMLSADGSQTLNKDINGHDTWLVWGFGGDIALDKDSYFYCDFERSAGGDINTKWQANIGLRWEW